MHHAKVELSDALCHVFVLHDLTAGPPNLSQEGAPTPTPDLERDKEKTGLGGGVWTGPPGAGPHFLQKTEPCSERWEAGTKHSLFSKANQQSAKDGNEQD